MSLTTNVTYESEIIPPHVLKNLAPYSGWLKGSKKEIGPVTEPMAKSQTETWFKASNAACGQKGKLPLTPNIEQFARSLR